MRIFADLVKHCAHDECGTTMIECGVLIGVIATAAVVTVGDNIPSPLTTLLGTLVGDP